MINEKLLQHIWANGSYNHSDLRTTIGNSILLINPGTFNVNQGPDFLNAQLKIDGTIWAGHIEIHVKSSDWKLHGHESDPNYRNVILHVVFKHDSADQHPFPTLELQDRIPHHVLSRYESMMRSPGFIPCEKQLNQFAEKGFKAWKQRMAVERLEQKSMLIYDQVKEANFHWEEVFWWHIAKSFGYRVNAESFFILAQSIPLSVLSRNRSNLIQLEAILFGQAGLLNRNFDEAYPSMLKKEYLFIKKKYKLQPVSIPIYFLRMRPANFPTIRLAQLASLIFQSHQLFTITRETAELDNVSKLFLATPNDYWLYHYRFDEPSSYKIKQPGHDMINRSIINTVIPFLFAYGQHKDEVSLVNRAFKWLNELPAEDNIIMRKFSEFNIVASSAFDSQSLLHLKTNYCDQRRCLECEAGKFIISG